MATAPDRDLLQRLLDLDAKMRKWRRAHGLGPVNCFHNATCVAAERAEALPRVTLCACGVCRVDGMAIEIRPGFGMPTSGRMELDFTVSRFPRTHRRAVTRSTFRTMLRKLRLRVLMPDEEVRLLGGRLVPVHMLRSDEREEVEQQEQEWEREFAAKERDKGDSLAGIDMGQDGAEMPLREKARRANIACVAAAPFPGFHAVALWGHCLTLGVDAQCRACQVRDAAAQAGGDGAVLRGAGWHAAALCPRVRAEAPDGLPGRRPRPPGRPPQLPELRPFRTAVQPARRVPRQPLTPSGRAAD